VTESEIYGINDDMRSTGGKCNGNSADSIELGDHKKKC